MRLVWYWFGIICYIIASQVAVGILAWSMLITIGIAFVLVLLILGGLAWKMVQRGGKHEKRVAEDTMTLPTPRAAKMRRRYLH